MHYIDSGEPIVQDPTEGLEGHILPWTICSILWLLKPLPKVLKAVNPQSTIFDSLASSSNSRMQEKPSLSSLPPPPRHTKFSPCLKITGKFLCTLFFYHKIRLTSTNLKWVFLEYNRAGKLHILVIIEMSKMIKNEFISAPQIFVAFQHHGKVSRNKILHDISQNIKEKNINFKEIRKCHQEKSRAKDLK